MSETLAAPLSSALRDGAADHLIVTIPGDGVGPDVVSAARRVLDAAGSKFGFKLAWREILAGGCAIDAYGVAVREEDLLVADAADALLLGAVGGPKWDNPNGTVRPEQALFAFRTRYELFANLRPVTILPELYDASPLKSERLVGVDLMMVRELTGGLYFGSCRFLDIFFTLTGLRQFGLRFFLNTADFLLGSSAGSFHFRSNFLLFREWWEK